MTTKKRKLLINCDEAKFICDKSQYNESTLWDRIRLSIRYVYCHITRSYVKRNKKLSDLISHKNVTCMSNASKIKLKTEFKKELQDK